MQKYNCQDLTIKNVGEKVTLSGWVNKRRDLGNLIFIDLRDKYGITQLIFDPTKSLQSHKIASKLKAEYVITVQGTVEKRKDPNPKIKTGEIEILADTVTILSVAKTLPFELSEDIKEELNLKYRYLDLRRGKILKNLHIRHKAILAIRNFLDKENFTEIETPILSKTTPEGARDYLVPSRIYPGNFYALPQSPQLFKQLLMISGMHKYFQIAKCFRDEDLRADRQPEFTQLDLEMSFSSLENLFSLIENLLKEVFKKTLDIDIKTPFPRLSYEDCMNRYGSDKPDLRYGMELKNIEEIIKKSDFSYFKDELKIGNTVKGFCIKKKASFSRKILENYKEKAALLGIKKFTWLKNEEEISSSMKKYFSKNLLQELLEKMHMEKNDLAIFVAGEKNLVNQSLDFLRKEIAKQENLIPKNSYNFLWVIDFPMFCQDKKTAQIKSEHHPFTSPNPEDIDLLEKHPLKVRAQAYDLVINGYEAGSGSQRIHSSDLQEKIFNILKLSPEDIKIKFGYFIEALKYGTPPHLGIALGMDRLAMILSNTNNIRDVIAFPKTQNACDLMTQSPSKPDEVQLQELHLKIQP